MAMQEALSSGVMLPEELAKRTAFSVWIVDYPGYGKSEGQISSEGQLHQIAHEFYKESVQLVSGGNRIVIYGRSIGSGLAVELASKSDVAGLVLESPYMSLPQVVREKLPWIPVSLLKYKFENDHLINKVKAPILVVHGDQDEVIPFEQGRALAGLHPQTRFVDIRNGHHNDLGNFKDTWMALDKFLNSIARAESIR